MLELGKASIKEHSAIGKMFKQMKFENLLTYGADSFNTHRAAKGVKNNFYFNDKQSMSAFLNLQIKKGDVLLVKGSRSMKMEEIINNISVN